MSLTLNDPSHPVNVMYRQHLEYMRSGGAESNRARLGLCPVRADAVVPRSRQDLRDHYTAILEGKIVRNLSVYPATYEEKKAWLERKYEEWRNIPAEQVRFGDMTGAIIQAIMDDISHERSRKDD